MRRSILALLLSGLMLFTLFPGAHTASASEPAPLELMMLEFPTAAAQGDTIKIAARLAVNTRSGVCCGYAYLEGPGEQRLTVFLQPSTPQSLSGQLVLPESAPTGKWTIGAIELVDNYGDAVTVDLSESNLGHTFFVRGSNASDVEPPRLLSLVAPDQATTGEPVVITATVADDASGIESITATVEPDMEKSSLWRRSVRLFPTGKKNEFSGVLLMDATSLPTKAQRVTKVVLRDRSGNTATVDRKTLDEGADHQPVTGARALQVPDGLKTSPYLDVVHPGALGYWNWLVVDRVHTQALFLMGRTNARAVREMLAAEIPMLRDAAEKLRKEIYTDPATKLRVVPFATTGKWLALEAALGARTDLLLELERREGKLDEEMEPLTSAGLAVNYAILDQGELLIPMENTANDLYAQLPAAYLKVLGSSPEAVKVLQSPSFESGNLSSWHFTMERDVIYFVPALRSGSTVSLSWGTATMNIYVGVSGQLTAAVSDLYYEIGRHMGQAYFSSMDD